MAKKINTELIIRKMRKGDINNCLKLQKLDNENYWKKKDFEEAIKFGATSVRVGSLIFGDREKDL